MSGGVEGWMSGGELFEKRHSEKVGRMAGGLVRGYRDLEVYQAAFAAAMEIFEVSERSIATMIKYQANESIWSKPPLTGKSTKPIHPSTHPLFYS